MFIIKETQTNVKQLHIKNILLTNITTRLIHPK